MNICVYITGDGSCDSFLCNNGLLIKRQYMCDGDNDCGDFSDEDNSPNGTCGNK